MPRCPPPFLFFCSSAGARSENLMAVGGPSLADTEEEAGAGAAATVEDLCKDSVAAAAAGTGLGSSAGRADEEDRLIATVALLAEEDAAAVDFSDGGCRVMMFLLVAELWAAGAGMEGAGCAEAAAAGKVDEEVAVTLEPQVVILPCTALAWRRMAMMSPSTKMPRSRR